MSIASLPEFSWAKVAVMSEEERGRASTRGHDEAEAPTLPAPLANDPTPNDSSTPLKMSGLPEGLIHLKTRAENRAQTDTIQVWTIEIPAKLANHALKCVPLHLSLHGGYLQFQSY